MTIEWNISRAIGGERSSRSADEMIAWLAARQHGGVVRAQLVALAAVVTADQLERAFEEAEYRRLTSPVSLDALPGRYPGRRGTQAIRRVLDHHRKNGETRTTSSAGFSPSSMPMVFHDPPSTARASMASSTPGGRSSGVVECDGFAAHGTRKAFEEDRARDRALVADGWRVVRVTWRQLTSDGDTIVAQLATLLAQPAASSRPAHRSTARSWAA